MDCISRYFPYIHDFITYRLVRSLSFPKLGLLWGNIISNMAFLYFFVVLAFTIDTLHYRWGSLKDPLQAPLGCSPTLVPRGNWREPKEPGFLRGTVPKCAIGIQRQFQDAKRNTVTCYFSRPWLLVARQPDLMTIFITQLPGPFTPTFKPHDGLIAKLSSYQNNASIYKKKSLVK